MIRQSDLISVLESQKKIIGQSDFGLVRSVLPEISLDLQHHALIVSGVRRCGKSTLMNQLIKQHVENTFFLNFDVPKLYNFDIHDFDILDIEIKKSGAEHLYFDEIQVVEGWELYVRQKLDEGFRVVITGSNATLLSKELGTKLTGRHISKELFPFSFNEFVEYKKLDYTNASILQYLNSGGFPEYIKTGNTDVLMFLLDDILYRDVAVRYNLRDVNSLKRLITFLATNVGKLTTANKLTSVIGIKSTATVLEYLSHLENTYLLHLLPKFSYSYRSQIVSPRKIYMIDNGLVDLISASFSEDLGRKLENMIFMELRRKHKELFYFNENGSECDIVVFENNQPIELIQVCAELTHDNIAREQSGLLEAMNYFKIDKGIIITLNQTDCISVQGRKIDVVPAHEYLRK